MALSSRRRTQVLSGSFNGTLRVWDVGSGSCVGSLAGAMHTTHITCCAALGGGRVATGSSDTSIKIWELSQDGSVRAARPHT